MIRIYFFLILAIFLCGTDTAVASNIPEACDAASSSEDDSDEEDHEENDDEEEEEDDGEE